MESLSKYLLLNNSDQKQQDKSGRILEGIRISETGNTIFRFRNGLLDGDIFNDKGELVVSKPAVESPGHQEYWREGKLHRDNGLPAVISESFKVKEWWVNGQRIK